MCSVIATSCSTSATVGQASPPWRTVAGTLWAAKVYSPCSTVSFCPFNFPTKPLFPEAAEPEDAFFPSVDFTMIGKKASILCPSLKLLDSVSNLKPQLAVKLSLSLTGWIGTLIWDRNDTGPGWNCTRTALYRNDTVPERHWTRTGSELDRNGTGLGRS